MSCIRPRGSGLKNALVLLWPLAPTSEVVVLFLVEVELVTLAPVFVSLEMKRSLRYHGVVNMICSVRDMKFKETMTEGKRERNFTSPKRLSTLL